MDVEGGGLEGRRGESVLGERGGGLDDVDHELGLILFNYEFLGLSFAFRDGTDSGKGDPPGTAYVDETREIAKTLEDPSIAVDGEDYLNRRTTMAELVQRRFPNHSWKLPATLSRKQQ